MDSRVLHRFWEKVDKLSDDKCWIWLGAKSNTGTGIFVLRGATYVQAHRFSLEISGNKLDRGTFVKHICGNKLCVNPRHLKIFDRNIRFWKFVDIRDNDDCWEWLGNLRGGYGRFSIEGISQPAHRVSYELSIGKIPDGMILLHKCDNRLCVNPNHLQIGTTQENSDDMVAKDRQARGSKNGFSKLTENNVLEIKKLLKDRQMRNIDIARMFNVSDCTIADISAGRTWSWLEI